MKHFALAAVLTLWTAEIMSGRDIDEVLAAHSDDWAAQVEAFNKLFT